MYCGDHLVDSIGDERLVEAEARANVIGGENRPVTTGFEDAFEQATAAAGGRGVDIAGGGSTVRQALAAGVIDELLLDIAPVLLGQGERIFDGVTDPGFEPIEVMHSPNATHIRYRVGR